MIDPFSILLKSITDRNRSDRMNPVSILLKSISDRYRPHKIDQDSILLQSISDHYLPDRIPVGPITVDVDLTEYQGNATVATALPRPQNKVRMTGKQQAKHHRTVL